MKMTFFLPVPRLIKGKPGTYLLQKKKKKSNNDPEFYGNTYFYAREDEYYSFHLAKYVEMKNRMIQHCYISSEKQPVIHVSLSVLPSSFLLERLSPG